MATEPHEVEGVDLRTERWVGPLGPEWRGSYRQSIQLWYLQDVTAPARGCEVETHKWGLRRPVDLGHARAATRS